MRATPLRLSARNAIVRYRRVLLSPPQPTIANFHRLRPATKTPRFHKHIMMINDTFNQTNIVLFFLRFAGQFTEERLTTNARRCFLD